MQHHPHPAPGDFGLSSLWKIPPAPPAKDAANPLKGARSCQVQPTCAKSSRFSLFPLRCLPWAAWQCLRFPRESRSWCRGGFGASQNITEEQNRDDTLIFWCQTGIKPNSGVQIRIRCKTRIKPQSFGAKQGLNPNASVPNQDQTPQGSGVLTSPSPQCLQLAFPPPPNSHLPPFYRICSYF